MSHTDGRTAASRTKSLVDFAHDDIHRRITDGELAEGERIVIDRLARSLGTSLIPVREALARLHAEGLVSFERNKGYRVAPRLTCGELRRLFEARLVIETGAVELALARAGPLDLDPLRALNRLIGEGSYGTTYERFRGFVALNERFHVGLVALADNPLLDDAYRRLAYHQQITRPSYGRGPGDVARIVREHEAILAAVERADLDRARAAIRAHIAGGLENLAADGPDRR